MVFRRLARSLGILAVGSLWTGAAVAGFVTPIVTPSPSPLMFAPQAIGSTSVAHTETYTVSGGAAGTAMVVNSISTTGDFAVVPGGTCQTGIANAVPNSGSCTVVVSFTPTAGGPRSGTLTLNCTSVIFAGAPAFTCSMTSSDLIVSLLGAGVTLGTPIPTLSSLALAMLSGALILYAFLGLSRRRV
jgi:hypothetical protein